MNTEPNADGSTAAALELDDEIVAERSAETPSDKPSDTKPSYDLTKKYDFAQTEYIVPCNIDPYADEEHWTQHKLNKPDFAIEDARERGTPFFTETIQKQGRGNDRFRQDYDDEPANVKFYDKTIKEISGYPLSSTVKRYEGGPTTLEDPSVKEEKTLDLEDGMILDEVNPNELFLFEGKPVPYKSLIPGYHKTSIVNKLLQHQYEIDAGKNFFALGAGRRWKVKQEMGGGTDENGGEIPPQYAPVYTLREPMEAERRKFRSKAIGSSGQTIKGATRETRVTNLRIFVELFDAMIEDVDALYDSQPFDAKNSAHIDAIPATFKKLVVGKLMRSLEVDLGN